MHLGLSFLQNNKYGFIFIFLHTDCWLDQHYLMKIDFFFIVYMCMYVYIYIWNY